ncbi:uncharacterized protein [Cherax quadricarinatus]|uniref:uncharacterized protein isoform X2 n=1 Tax=Cherax quadricarinatus TaxID=27406 RepID=UPI00387E7399
MSQGSVMEYAAMLSAPDLVCGLQDLLADPDHVVVKRTIRVFANVYRHALQLLATGDLDEATFNGAWPAVKSVAEQLISMLATSENEGLIVHIVRFLEAALVAHLLSDVSRFPELASQTPKIVSRGVDALKALVTTPYVGGSAFIVAVRALITVACYKRDLWVSVTNLIQKQVASPPPTLFDHNVRSLHKILQRNLFRLLRRADTTALRAQLIDMMVTVGVPRRMLSQWAPPQESRKRSAQVAQSEDAITGRNTPPTAKRIKGETESVNERRGTPPRDPRESRSTRDGRIPRDMCDIRGDSRDPRVGADPRDPRTVQRSDPRLSPPHDPRDTPTQDPPSKPNTPPASGRSTPEDKVIVNHTKKVKEVNSNFEFLKSLITSTKSKEAPSPERFSEKERALYERLDHPHVVELVLSCLDSVPDSPPEDLLTKLGHGSGDVDGIREHLTRLLAPHLHTDFINSLTPVEENTHSNPPSRPPSTCAATVASCDVTPPLSILGEPSPPSPPSSNRSTPTDPSLLCSSDVDLRQLLDRGFQSTGDIDMRPPRDLKRETEDNSAEDPRSSRTDPRLIKTSSVDFRDDITHPRAIMISTSTRLDPRITNDPRSVSDHLDIRATNMDPRITQSFADGINPRLGSCPDPREQMMGNSQQNFMSMGSGLPGMRNMMQNNFQNFDATFGNGHVINQQDSLMMNSSHGIGLCNGPMDLNMGRLGNGNPHDQGFVGGGNNMFNMRPDGLGGPWQQNRMPMMMPLMNGGPGMFPQAPPMHL